MCYFCIRISGCSSARLEYTSGGRVVAGSNPVIPTGLKALIIVFFKKLSGLFRFQAVGICFLPILSCVNVISCRIDGNNHGKFLYMQFSDSFGTQLLKSDKLRTLYTLSHQGSSPADSGEINAGVPLYRFDDFGAARAFSNHHFETLFHQQRRVCIHASARGRPYRADGSSRFGRARPCIIDRLTSEIERHRFVVSQHFG